MWNEVYKSNMIAFIIILSRKFIWNPVKLFHEEARRLSCPLHNGEYNLINFSQLFKCSVRFLGEFWRRDCDLFCLFFFYIFAANIVLTIKVVGSQMIYCVDFLTQYRILLECFFLLKCVSKHSFTELHVGKKRNI